jgi:hypothetical protein
MNMRRIVFALWCLLFVSSCATTVSSIKNDALVVNETNSSSSLNSGYLLIGVETNRDLKNIFISGMQTIKLSHEDLRFGTNYILINLAAGNYLVDSVALNSYQKLRLGDEENWHFKIKANTISYIGHLELQSRGFFSLLSRVELVNRSTEALEFMNSDFPTILAARKMYFGGPSDDYFFDYLNGEVVNYEN